MAQLAALDLVKWSTGKTVEAGGTHPLKAAWAFEGAPPTGGLAAILRMARRDPELFFSLDRGSEATLAALAYELGQDEREILHGAIQASVEASPGGLARAWRMIRDEHVRESLIRRDATDRLHGIDVG